MRLAKGGWHADRECHNGWMVTIPAIVWRGGSFRRGVTVGVSIGVFFGVLAWLDSGIVLSGAIVFVVLGIGSGFGMARRMARCWPGARDLTGSQRVAVVAAARRGERVGDDALAPAVVDYSRALRTAAEEDRPLVRWAVVVLLLVAAATAVWDAVQGSLGNIIVSVIYLALAGLEMFWWPRRRAELLANADRASSAATA
jgi:hypothetical protein